MPAFNAASVVSLLLIEDDLVDEMAFLKAVKEQGLPYRVRVARSVAQARSELAGQAFDIILSDYNLGDGTCFDLIDAFGAQLVLLVAGMGEEQIAVRALELGVHDYMLKDPQRGYLKLLKWRVATALQQTNLARQLHASQASLRATLDAVPDLLFELDLQGRYHDYHSARSDLLAAPAEVFLGKLVSDILPSAAAAVVMASLEQADREGFSIGQQMRLDLAQGPMWFELSVVRKVDAASEQSRFVVLSRDITARKQSEEALRQSLQDKEALLREVHHRVKNNLQVITSLLRLEAGRSSLPQTKSVLDAMQGRIRSMALLHETLYRSGVFAGSDLSVYLAQVATQVFRLSASGRVRLTLDLAPLKVGLDLATPCGLLLNELVSNCFKHGFASGADEAAQGGALSEGEVRVSLQPLAGGPRWRLTVSDTGAGLPADFEARRERSLGLQLVSDLAHQIGGQLEVGAGPAAEFSVSFLPR
ncbi:sensor histidine kinase [Roseateles albus]|uniref:Histidine kinase dimerization/phosphoacceptor domain -containing protein n=1 Tax=Roseateles albus TaxID=2987525 RepID=A0ABT5KGQ8_9BURK|nr:histidine kinase dimerization/phosphoacceptor domain -containing protein [Roseateles albus]MDC8773112.1 histidine kinase dimerization/phosphoacceptor domain -containing protein [Roseateles albus]